MENNTRTKKGTLSPSSIDHLPVDIIETILSRLPVKSLLRFKTVCRSWQALISHPRFSRIHHHRTIQQSHNSNLFLARPRDKFPSSKPKNKKLPPDQLSFIKFENQEFRTESVLEIPFGPATPLCSCNGILLLDLYHCSSGNVYVLWNPSIRKYTSIRCPLRPHNRSLFDYGLYHDERTDDYKVVVMSWDCYTVYSCKNTSWAEAKPLPFRRTGPYRDGGIFVDGSFYWCSRGLESYKGEIVCFDVRDERLKKLPRPGELKAIGIDEICLAALSGRLCLYHVKTDGTKLQLWVMEKHGDENCSWRMIMNLETDELDLYFINTACLADEDSVVTINPVCLTDEDDVVIHAATTRSGAEFVYIYNHCEKSFSKLEEVCWKLSTNILPYSESLFFPSSE